MIQYIRHSSRAAESVSRDINTDDDLYAVARECVSNARNSGKSMDYAAESILAILHDRGITKTLDGTTYTKSTIREAIRGY